MATQTKHGHATARATRGRGRALLVVGEVLPDQGFHQFGAPGAASVTWKKESCPASRMRRISWICGSVWSMKFLGLPPPISTTALLPPARLAARTKAVVSFTSIEGFTRNLLPRSSTPATFMPMVESPGEEV